MVKWYCGRRRSLYQKRSQNSAPRIRRRAGNEDKARHSGDARNRRLRRRGKGNPRSEAEPRKSGKLKSVYLNEKTPIKTLYGDIEAELVSFYENGAIKRIFPRYGALSAYWSEKEEAGITDYIDFYLGGKSFRVRPHNILFYETGEIRSVTIYNCDTLSVNTKYGIIRTNIGLSFYKNGEIERIEPAFKTQIEVDGKVIRPFYFLADGMHADHNSLVFDGNGNIISYYGKDIDLKGK